MLRVIAGKYKRTPLQTLEGEEITRPTRDMVREALFSTIMIHNETSLLDLFSGSGAIGIEALSRGAKDAVFNDSNRQAVSIIKKNLEKVHEDRIVLQLDYREALEKLKNHGFDFIYCDPPYRFEEYEELFELIERYNVINDDGVVIMEVEKKSELDEAYGAMHIYKEKRYGISKLLYYRKGEKE